MYNKWILNFCKWFSALTITLKCVCAIYSWTQKMFVFLHSTCFWLIFLLVYIGLHLNVSCEFFMPNYRLSECAHLESAFFLFFIR